LWGGGSISHEEFVQATSEHRMACLGQEMIVGPTIRSANKSSVIVSCAGRAPAVDHLVELSYLARFNTWFGEMHFWPTA
jgi:hypothetical protein